MSKRAKTNGARAIERRLAEGRGQGRGANYKPWINIHDFPSRGQANRVRSPLHGRTCHMHSKLEAEWFYAFHALKGLTDLREQFPLDLDETLGIAKELSIVHPTDPKSQQPCVVTTDFLLTISDGLREIDMAAAIKPSADLASTRVLEKLEIERVYWSPRSTSWRILTEKELPRAVVKNVQWVQPHIDLVDCGAFSASAVARIRSALEPEVSAQKHSLVEVTARCDDLLGIKVGSSLCVVRHLIGIGAWSIDFTIEIDPGKPLKLLSRGFNADSDKFAA